MLQSFDAEDADELLNAYRRWKGIPVCIGETNRLFIRESTKEDYPALSRILSEVRETDEGCISLRQNIEKDQYLAYIKEVYRIRPLDCNCKEQRGDCRLVRTDPENG